MDPLGIALLAVVSVALVMAIVLGILRKLSLGRRNDLGVVSQRWLLAKRQQE